VGGGEREHARRLYPWDGGPYELRYDEYAGVFTEDELQVITVDYSKRRR